MFYKNGLKTPVLMSSHNTLQIQWNTGITSFILFLLYIISDMSDKPY